MLVTCQRFGELFLFGLVWQYSSIQKNIIKVGSKSWILTCSCHIILSLPFYTYPASKRELNFCNGYLSLLYFWVDAWCLIFCFQTLNLTQFAWHFYINLCKTGPSEHLGRSGFASTRALTDITSGPEIGKTFEIRTIWKLDVLFPRRRTFKTFRKIRNFKEIISI